MQVGQMIRLFRIANDFTIVELSKLSGCSKSYITEIEKGKKNCSLKMLEKLTKAMNIDLDTFRRIKKEIEEKNEENFQKCLYRVLQEFIDTEH